MDISEHLQKHKRQFAEEPEMSTPTNNNTNDSSNGSFYDSAKLQGRNHGAKMLVCRSGTGDNQDCCINIYISNNVQGVNNSILVGSDVKMGDPGVSLSFRDIKVGYKTFDKLRKKTRTRARRRRNDHSPSSSSRDGSSRSLMVILLLIFFFLFLR